MSRDGSDASHLEATWAGPGPILVIATERSRVAGLALLPALLEMRLRWGQHA
jgi:hypothetical protein